MLGQLQHLGQILFWARYPKPYAEALGRLAAGGKTDVVTVEREAFGVTHQEVGYLLARRLALPEAVVQVIYHHHEPEAAGSFQPRAVLVHVADVLACALGCGSDGDPYVRPLKIKKETLAALGLTMEDVEPVCEAVLLGFKDFDAYHASV